jgi:hypothetical protein
LYPADVETLFQVIADACPATDGHALAPPVVAFRWVPPDSDARLDGTLTRCFAGGRTLPPDSTTPQKLRDTILPSPHAGRTRPYPEAGFGALTCYLFSPTEAPRIRLSMLEASRPPAGPEAAVVVVDPRPIRTFVRNGGSLWRAPWERLRLTLFPRGATFTELDERGFETGRALSLAHVVDDGRAADVGRMLDAIGAAAAPGPRQTTAQAVDERVDQAWFGAHRDAASCRRRERTGAGAGSMSRGSAPPTGVAHTPATGGEDSDDRGVTPTPPDLERGALALLVSAVVHTRRARAGVPR